MKRAVKFCVAAALFACIVSSVAACTWMPDKMYDKEYTFTGELKSIVWDDEGGWQGFIPPSDPSDPNAQVENVTPRAAFERLKGEIDWSDVTASDGSPVVLDGISASSSTDDIIKSLNGYVEDLNSQLAQENPYKDIKISVSGKDSPSVTISVPEREAKTFSAQVIETGMQASFGEGDFKSYFTLEYIGSTTKTYGLSLRLQPTEALAVFGEDVPITIGTVQLNFPKAGEPGVTAYYLNLFFDFTVA